MPSLQDDAIVLSQSMAIIEYLEEVHPQVALLPKDAVGRARVRELAQIIARRLGLTGAGIGVAH